MPSGSVQIEANPDIPVTEYLPSSPLATVVIPREAPRVDLDRRRLCRRLSVLCHGRTERRQCESQSDGDLKQLILNELQGGASSAS